MVHNFVDHNFVNQAELIHKGAQKGRFFLCPFAPLCALRFVSSCKV